MTKKNYFQISTAIDYPSGPPHCGHLYEKICTDVLARWHRLNGEKVHFSTGLDCHGSKIQKYAEKAGKTPEEFVKEMEKPFMELCEKYNISYDDFIKTTEKRHEKIVIELIKNLNKTGDIYIGEYSGYYCSDCETYYSENELENGECPTHKRPAEFLKEKAYFFKMSKYQDKLINNLMNDTNSVWPEGQKKLMLNRLKEPLRDLCLTREKVKWGIPFPLDEKLTVAIWIDALINYLSTVDYPKKKYKDFWPAKHVIGHDILWHHNTIWKSFLMACEIELPSVIVHGFIKTKGGEKMSKSKGTVIDPLELIKTYPADSIRYFLLREIPFGADGDFSEEALIERNNNELANELGNLVNRTIGMIEKYYGGKYKKGKADKELFNKLQLEQIKNDMYNYEFSVALSNIWKFISEINKYINDNKPWENEKDREKILYNVLDSIRIISILVSSFIPETSEKINEQIGVKAGKLKDVKPSLLKEGKVKKGELLFNKMEIKHE